MVMRYALIFILLSTLSCHSLNNSGRHPSSLSKTAGSNHKVDKKRLNNLLFSSDLKTRISAQQELLSYIEGEQSLVVTKSILIGKDNKPKCIMDVYGDKDLVPDFANVSPEKVKSNFSIKGDLATCRSDEVQNLKTVARNSYFEGDKLSLLPAIAAAGVLGMCAAGFVTGSIGAAAVETFVDYAMNKKLKTATTPREEHDIKILYQPAGKIEAWAPAGLATGIGATTAVLSTPPTATASGILGAFGIGVICTVVGYRSVVYIMEDSTKNIFDFFKILPKSL